LSIRRIIVVLCFIVILKQRFPDDITLRGICNIAGRVINDF
jgi:hypothetical protein